MRLFLLLVFSFYLLACSSTPKTHLVQKKLDPNAELNSRVFSKDLTAIELKKASARLCPKRTPKNMQSWTKAAQLINACLKANKTLMAEKLTHKLIALSPQSPWGGYYLSVIYELKGQLKKSYWLINLSLRKANKIGLLYYQKARVEWKMDQKPQAFDSLTTAVQLQPDLVGAHIQLSQIYHLRGEAKKAKKHFIQAKTLEPSVEKLKIFALYKAPETKASSARNPAKEKGVQ